MDTSNKLSLLLVIVGKVAIVGLGVMVGAVLGWLLAILTGLQSICGG